MRTSKAKVEENQRRRFRVFTLALKHYRAEWGFPAEKAAFRSLWLAAKSNVEDGGPHPCSTHAPAPKGRWKQIELPL